MRKLIALTGLAFVMTGTSTAQASLVKAFHKNHNAKQRMHVIEVNLAHTSYICKHGWGKVKPIHCQATRWLRHERTKLLPVLRTAFLSVRYKSAWLCIHSGWKNGVKVGHGEGSWTDSGDPYWGGLQMDRGFMTTYAPSWLLRRGWADKWTPLEQMWVAERAHDSGRGFGPWPLTARACGLL